jgi:peptide/nickel transport system substrate-binding protein
MERHCAPRDGKCRNVKLLERSDIDIARNLNPEDIVLGRRWHQDQDELKGRLMYLAPNGKQTSGAVQALAPVRRSKYHIDYEGRKQFQRSVHHSPKTLPATYLGKSDENPFTYNIEKL